MNKMDKEEENNYEFIIKDIEDLDHDWLEWTTGTEYIIKLALEIKNRAQIKRWCDKTLTDKVVFVQGNWSHYDQNHIIYFYSKADMVTFKLKWG